MAAMDKPTTADEKNSFDLNPRAVNAFASCRRFGNDVRYSGSPAGSTNVTVSAVSSDTANATPTLCRIKPVYVLFVSYSAPHKGQSLRLFRKYKPATSKPRIIA